MSTNCGISLSVLVTRINEPAEVASVSIYTIDDRVLAISGSASNSAPHFTHPIVFEDTVAGYARVTLNPAAGKPPALPLPLSSDPRVEDLHVSTHDLKSYDQPLEDKEDDENDESCGRLVPRS